ncbi:hypothetical protein OKW35_009968 [Paraburkholderia sp. MM5477-R1]
MATGSRWCSAANSCPTSRTDSVIRPGQATRPARRLRSRSSSSIRAAQRCGAGRTCRTGADNRPSCSTGRLAYARFRNCSLLGIVTFVRWCDEEIKIALSRSSFSRWRYQLRRALVFPLSVTGQGPVHRAPCTVHRAPLERKCAAMRSRRFARLRCAASNMAGRRAPQRGCAAPSSPARARSANLGAT